MSPKNNWRQKSLETLENSNWGDPSTAPTGLVKRCMELSKIPVDNFTLSDLRIMIGQKFGLDYLVPIAVEKIKKDIFIETDFYEGDLLENILKIDTSFWDNNQQVWTDLDTLIKFKQPRLKELKIETTKFYNSKFAATKSSR